MNQWGQGGSGARVKKMAVVWELMGTGLLGFCGCYISLVH